ncbi:MAG: hypothetical protein IPO29_00280 [Anaerolineae bacterium]|nr:hypothetical protein [Anaerolineae bacterium]
MDYLTPTEAMTVALYDNLDVTMVVTDDSGAVETRLFFDVDGSGVITGSDESLVATQGLSDTFSATPDPDARADADAGADQHPNGDADRDANPHADTDPDADPDPHPHAHADGDGHAGAGLRRRLHRAVQRPQWLHSGR